ncbi:glycosyltransferase family 2 protein [Vibrio cyclitrophicus]|uniref:glycosyltransferase family 2 protein n=1 Tax=Vibrio cyclitrophicus TaxID=47951 RepID=UPI000C8476CA|nr:glycosyltransferase family 2 protein [Vibrio cyclitrophicus]PMK23536.1 hypothetical protein BCU04_15300 [Vibrio cyclitrophicus]
MKTVDILLATYNGEKYIAELLQSISRQTYTDWMLIVRDDNSSDSTEEIVNSFKNNHPGKVILIKDSLSCGSAEKNFSELLSYSRNDYFAFCDQDDVWNDNKLELMVGAIEKLDNTKPALVFSDLEVVDENLITIDSSMGRSQKLDFPGSYTFPLLRVHNSVTGCATLANSLARETFGKPDLSNIRMHDWWLAAKVALTGKVKYIRQTTIKYRQHDSNVVGYQQFSILRFLSKINYEYLISDFNDCKRFNLELDGKKIRMPHYIYLRLSVLIRKLV